MEAVDDEVGMTSRELVRIVAREYGVSYENLYGRSRIKSLAIPRLVAMYLCRDVLHLSYPDIGRIFGRDHSSVISACRSILDRIKADQRMRDQIARLIEIINGSTPDEMPTCVGCQKRETKLAELRAILASAQTIAGGKR